MSGVSHRGGIKLTSSPLEYGNVGGFGDLILQTCITLLSAGNLPAGLLAEELHEEATAGEIRFKRRLKSTLVTRIRHRVSWNDRNSLLFQVFFHLPPALVEIISHLCQEHCCRSIRRNDRIPTSSIGVRGQR